MASYLGLALFAEGMNDHRFLRPLLRRAVEATCARYARAPVEVSEPHELHTPRGLVDADRATRIAEAARQAHGAWHLLFVHTDGAGDAARARAERVGPAADAIHGDDAFRGSRVVAVVPVRETEAWLIADGHALRAAFGTNLSNEALGVPARSRDAEGVADPKAVWRDAYRRVVGARRSVRTVSNYLDVLGERVSLEVLHDLPSYARMEAELLAALRALRIA